jgi:hypothetical protein
MSEKISDDWPILIFGHVAVSRWTHPDGKQRVYLIARGDGLFGRWSEHFSDDEDEMCWTPDDLGASLYDSEETAVREIHSASPWSREVPREDGPVVD